MISSTETQDEHPRRDKASRKYSSSSKTGQISKVSSSALFPDQEMGDGGNMPPPIVSEQPPIRCPAPFETENLAFDRTLSSSFEERTEYYDQRTCCMYHRILNYRIRRDTSNSSTSSPRRNKDLQIEENHDMRQKSMLSTAIDQDTCLQCMEEIFDLEM